MTKEELLYFEHLVGQLDGDEHFALAVLQEKGMLPMDSYDAVQIIQMARIFNSDTVYNA